MSLSLNETREVIRNELMGEHGVVWDTVQMTNVFEVVHFMAPYVVVRRRLDGVKGTLKFTHRPRFYFQWQEGA